MIEAPRKSGSGVISREALEMEARSIRDELLRRAEAKRSAAKFERYRHDPVGFQRDILRWDPWDRQSEILVSVDRNVHTYARSGQKTGKSKGAGGTALWWVSTRERGLVVMTSGNAQQVKAILWRELRKLYRDSGAERSIGGIMHKDPATGFDLGDGRAIYGLTADDAERIAGYSGDELLFIIDEASGFDEELHEAIEGNLGGGGHELAMGNPTRATGWFIKGFKSKANSRIHIDSRESPNVKAGKKIVPGLALATWVEEMREKYGENSPQFQVRVAGNPPEAGERVVVGLAAWEGAKARWLAAMGEARTDEAIRARLEQLARAHELTYPTPKKPTPWAERLHVGVDVARFGDDDSVIAPRRGDFVYPLSHVHGFDIVEVAGLALQRARALRRDPNERVVINVDTDGLGAGVADHLRRHRDVDVQDVSSAASASAKDEYHALRDEGWWGLRTFLAEGGMVPPDDDLEEEALAPTYDFDERNRVRVEAKKETKKRLKRSPDRADALWLSIRTFQPLQTIRVRNA